VTTQSQWRQSGDIVDQQVTANEGLSYAVSIDKQNSGDADQCINSTTTYELFGLVLPIQAGAYDDLIVDSSNRIYASGSFIISGNAVEGRYCTTIRVADLAGNTAQQGQQFFIDNTKPDNPTIDTDGWGLYNGIETKAGYIADGRLVPEFVHEENMTSINAWAEENVVLEYYVNADLVYTSNQGSGDCIQKLNQDKSIDTVLVQDKDICLYSSDFEMTQNGKDYVFQVISSDRSGNKSIVSEDEIVYFDNEKPFISRVLSTKSASYDPTPGWVSGLDISITKDLAIDLRVHAESLSDLEFSSTGPNNFNNYIFTTTQGNQQKTQRISLGNSIDEDKPECVTTVEKRRIGICQDGLYKVSSTSTDAAGNKSDVMQHTIERDTVIPGKPIVSEASLCGSSICIDISGEPGTDAVVNSINQGAVSPNTQTFKPVQGWSYSTNYTFTIYIIDKAGNKSESEYREIRTPSPGLSRGSLDGATREDPYTGKKGSDSKPIRFDTTIYSDGNYQLSNIEIPAPILTLVYTTYDDKVDIYGVGIPKNHPIATSITFEYITYLDALEYCDTNLVQILYDRGKKDCVSNATGRDDLDRWYGQLNRECGYAIPLFTQKCIFDHFKDDRLVVHEGEKNFNVQHSLVSLHKNDTNSTNFSQLWNDAPDGRFYKRVNLNEQLKVGDKVKARVSIFGDFEVNGTQVNYRGINLEDAKNNHGLRSDYSNKLEVEESEFTMVDGVESKILPIPYINQYLEPNNTDKYPPSGNVMCGASSAVITAAYYGKLNYIEDHDVKKYQYSDSGQGIVDDSQATCGPLMGGAFELTNWTCNQSHDEGIKNYLSHHGLNTTKLGSNLKNTEIDVVKDAIDKGHPIIFNINGGGVGHILTIIGYTTDGRIVVNDSWTNLEKYGKGFRRYDSGYHSLYPLNSNVYTRGYFLEVHK